MSKFSHLILPFIAGMMMSMNKGEIPEEEGGNMGEDSLCLKCKSFNTEDRVRSCYIANSFVEFCKHNKVQATITGCANFEEKTPINIEEGAE
jgi:hypothetical protein